jgi:hypothetical protein
MRKVSSYLDGLIYYYKERNMERDYHRNTIMLMANTDPAISNQYATEHPELVIAQYQPPGPPALDIPEGSMKSWHPWCGTDGTLPEVEVVLV